ncbi:MAG: hypothetical protein ACK4WH_01000 [Phycisphaerales bacterium]
MPNFTFRIDQTVVERVGEPGPNRYDQRVQIVDLDSHAGTVTTSTGRVYDALTGRRVPANSLPYRSIRSIAYETYP